MNEMVASETFFPSLNIAMGERMYDNVSTMSAELNAIFMALECLMNNQTSIPNLQNIVVYFKSLLSLELLYSASQY